MTCRILRILNLLIFFLLSSCSSLFRGSEVSSNSGDYKDNSIIEDDNATNARFLFLESEINISSDTPEDTLEKLEKANKLSEEKSPTILKRLCQIYIRLGKIEKALEASNKALAISPDSLDLLKLKAGTLAASNRSVEAVDVYEQVISKSSKDEEEPYLLLSGLYLQLGKPEKAIDVLIRLSSINPDSFISRYYLGKLYASTGNYKKARAYLEEAISINQSEQLEFDYIKVLALDKDSDKAISRTKKLLEKNPSNAKARELLGELLLGTQKFSQALEVFEDAKTHGEDPVSLRYKVALLKLQNRDYEGAETELSFLVSQQPNNYEAKYYLATAMASRDKIKDAVLELKKIPSSHPLYKRAYGFGAFLLRQEGDIDASLSLINTAISNNPKDVELLSYKASLLKEEALSDDSNYKELFEVLNELVLLQPDNDQFLFNLGAALDERGRREEAKEKMELAILKNPKNANALNYLGYTIAEEGGDLIRAEGLVKKALEIEPENGYFLDSLGWINYKRNDLKNAEINLRKAVEKVPADGVILEHLGRALIKVGKKEEAISILKKALQHLELDEKLKDEAGQVSDLLNELH